MNALIKSAVILFTMLLLAPGYFAYAHDGKKHPKKEASEQNRDTSMIETRQHPQRAPRS